MGAYIRCSNSKFSKLSSPYFLVSKPPVEEISRDSFYEKSNTFCGAAVREISADPKLYSEYLASKASRTVAVAQRYGSRNFDSENARYFSYQLGNASVGLLRTQGGFSMEDVFEGDSWRKEFPGRTEITSTVDLRICHPLCENAGDILLEHQLRIDGERPLLNSSPANSEARIRAAELGFVEVNDSNMVLDPTQHPDKWTKNSRGEWQRANKPKLYLARTKSRRGSEGGVM